MQYGRRFSVRSPRSRRPTSCAIWLSDWHTSNHAASPIIAIGGKHDSDPRSAIERYETRLRLIGGVRWLLLPSIASDTEAVRQAESTSIRRKLLDNDVIVLPMNAAHSWAQRPLPTNYRNGVSSPDG